MIPVQGVENHTIAVLGLGRSGRATAAALREGGATVIAWDDSADTRAQAEADGLTITDLTRDAGWDGVAALIVSPGIPHLYPAPAPGHRAGIRARRAGRQRHRPVLSQLRHTATGRTWTACRASSASPARTGNPPPRR